VQSNWKQRKAERDRLLLLAQIEKVDIDTTADYINPLVAFFQKR
jgi:hypothetical protein